MGNESHRESVPSSVSEADPSLPSTDPLMSVVRSIGDKSPAVVEGFAQQIVSALLGRVGAFTMEIQDVANDLGITVDEIRYQLKNQGEDFPSLRKRVRMHLAAKYLIEGKSIERIADELGYSEITIFSATFKSWAGMTPHKFKKYCLRYSDSFAGVFNQLNTIEAVGFAT